jgi:surface antigen
MAAVGTQPQSAKANTFPQDQCTYWASERYHTLTGYYVPWSGNAFQWAGNASAYGWQNSSQPSVPSIMVLQPGVQGASGLYGHVGVVEKINTDGTFVASNLNWAPNPQDVKNITFRIGQGVSFVSAPGIASSPSHPPSTGGPVTQAANAITSFLNPNSTTSFTTSPKISIAPTDDVTTFLVDLDVNLAIDNPFLVPIPTFQVLGANVPDPLGWIQDITEVFVNDVGALVVRGLLIALGAFILFRILSNFIDFGRLIQTATGATGTIAKLAELGV